MSDVSAVVLTMGEPSTAEALASLRRQTLLPADVIVVHGVSPFHRAINQAAQQVATPFFVQVDADMILDPECMAELRRAVAPNTGIVVGHLRDALIGQVVGIKLFRTAPFRAVLMGDTISPDTDLGQAIGRAGWETVYTGQPVGDDPEAWRTYGEHRPDYAPDYTYRKYLLEGRRYRYRGNPDGLRWHFGRLEQSRHPSAVIAQIGLANGIFLETERDLLEPLPPDPTSARLASFLAGSSEDRSDRVGSLDPDTSSRSAFRQWYECGGKLIRGGDAGCFRSLLGGLAGCWKDDAALVAKIGLCRGLQIPHAGAERVEADFDLLEAFLAMKSEPARGDSREALEPGPLSNPAMRSAPTRPRPLSPGGGVPPMPDLSVILVPRSPSAPLARIIESVLAQPQVQVELLIVDDGSRPDTAQIVGEFPDERLRLLTIPGPAPTPRCWNRAIEASRAPQFTILSERDRLVGAAFAELCAALERYPEAALVHTYWIRVNQEGRIPLRGFRRLREHVFRRLPEDLDYRREMVVKNKLIQALPTYRKDVVAELGGFDETRTRFADYILALRLLDRAEIRVVPEVLCCRPAATPEISSYLRQLAVCHSLARAGSVRFLRTKPYHFWRLALAGLGRGVEGRLRGVVHRLRGRVRAALPRGVPLQRMRYELDSGRFYQWLVDHLSWWPIGRSRQPAGPGRPPRIAYVLWRYPQVSETFIRREIHALRSAGLTVDVIADEPGDGVLEEHPAAPAGEVLYLEPPDPPRAWQLFRTFVRKHPARVINLLCYVVSHRYTGRKRLRRDLYVLGHAMQLASFLRERGTTHLHAPWADQHAFIGLIAARLLGLSYSVQARAHEIHRRTDAFGLAEKLGNARFVVTNSAFNASHLRRLLGDRANGRLYTIYNGIDLNQFDPPARNGRSDSLRLLAVGRLVEQKGFDDLLRACATLRDRGLRFQCDIIGGPREPEETSAYLLLRKLHRRLALGGTVHFLGELPFSRVLAAYQQADVFVLPCVIAANGGSDVTPNALIEAMAMGLPVVSTPIAAIPEIVEDGTSGLLVPPRDPAALADALAKLLADSTLRARLGHAARKRIEERFDIAKNIRSYVALFQAAGN